MESTIKKESAPKTIRAQTRMGRSRTGVYIKGGSNRWADGHLKSGEAGDVPVDVVEAFNERSGILKFVAEGSEVEGEPCHAPVAPGKKLPKSRHED